MDLSRFFIDFIDHLAPKLDTYESAIYLYVLRHSRFVGSDEITIGFRSARKQMSSGVGTVGAPMSEATCREKVRSLEKKGCFNVISSESAGTRVRALLPSEIPGAVPDIKPPQELAPESIDFFETPANRLLIFEREGFHCFYCLRKIDDKNHVIEHVRSRPAGGNDYRNVVAACRQCNNRKGATTAADYLRSLYRDGFLDQSDFEGRLSHLERLLAGELKPDFTRVIAE